MNNHEIINEKNKYLAIFNCMVNPCYIVNEQQIITDVNPSFEKFIGFSKDQIIGRLCRNVLESDLCPTCPILDIIEQNQSFSDLETTISTLEKKRSVILHGNALIDVNGNNIGGLVIIHDVTIRKQFEQSLDAEKKRLFVTIKSIGDGVITTDVDGNVEIINEAASQWTGWSQKEAFGKSIEKVFNIINEQTRIACENPVKKVLETGTIVGLANHTALISKDGTERIIADSGAPIFDTDHKVIGAVLVFQDITERVKLEDRLHLTQKMESIGTLAGGIAHDFNNMLGVITGNLSYALSKINQNEEMYEVLSDVQEGAKRAQSLTQQLLTFAKGGAPIKKVADLNQIIKESAQFVIRGGKSRCDYKLSDDLWPTEIDPGQMNQTISNIVINANQAMPNGGVILLSTENIVIEPKSSIPLPTGKYIKIIIEDQGIGISNEHLPNIFDPYFSTKQKGSGLGLATTYSIVKKHDGHIAVYSELNKGTSFYIYLPVVEKNFELAYEKEKLEHTGDGKILIMDDDEGMLKMAKRILSNMNYESQSATDGTKAIEMYDAAMKSKQPFDLVILDLTIPGGMGGLSTIKELLKIDPNVKAIVSSGYSNDPVMSNYEGYGFCGIIPKPYSQDQVAEVLNKIFSEKD